MRHLVQGKGREEYTATGTDHYLDKKGNFEDIEKTDLDAKIACGQSGEVQLLERQCCKCGRQMQRITDTQKDQVNTKGTLTRCQVSESFHGDQSAPAARTAPPSTEWQIACKGKENCGRAVKSGLASETLKVRLRAASNIAETKMNSLVSE